MGIINLGVFVICILLKLPVVLGFNCTFERDFCNWTQKTTDVLQWKLFEADASNDMIIPSGDHTTGNGSFVYVNASTNGASQLKSEKIKGGQYCLSFWYFMVGPKAKAIKVYRTNNTTTIFSTYSSQGRLWKEAKVQVSLTQESQIVIEAKFNSKSGTGLIGVDDVSISTGPCPLDCNFNHGFCAWRVISTEVKWTRKRYDYESVNFTYVSSNQDFYLNVGKKQDNDAGAATMVSSWQKSVPKCLTFQVYLFGTMVNVLNVYIERYRDSYSQSWSIHNNYDKILHKEYIDINDTITNNSTYRIKFRASVTSDIDGNILIDNIASTDTHCPYGCESSPCENGATCKDGIHGNYTCVCTDSWSGHTCNVSLTTTTEETATKTSTSPATLSSCESSPCENGATCEDGIHGNYTCVCTESWSGHTCNESLTTTTEESATKTSTSPAPVSTRNQTPIVYIITPVVVVIVIIVSGIVAFIFRREQRQRKDDGDDQEFVSYECVDTGVDNYGYALTAKSRGTPTENNSDRRNEATNDDNVTGGEDDPSTNKFNDTDNWMREDTNAATTLTEYPSSAMYENIGPANVIKGVLPEKVGKSDSSCEESNYDTLSTALVKNAGTSGAEKGEGNEYDTFAKYRSAESGEGQGEQILDDTYDHVSYNPKLNVNTLHNDDDYSYPTLKY